MAHPVLTASSMHGNLPGPSRRSTAKSWPLWEQYLHVDIEHGNDTKQYLNKRHCSDYLPMWYIYIYSERLASLRMLPWHWLRACLIRDAGGSPHSQHYAHTMPRTSVCPCKPTPTYVNIFEFSSGTVPFGRKSNLSRKAPPQKKSLWHTPSWQLQACMETCLALAVGLLQSRGHCGNSICMWTLNTGMTQSNKHKAINKRHCSEYLPMCYIYIYSHFFRGGHWRFICPRNGAKDHYIYIPSIYIVKG